jgi:hypothetical protein
MPNLEIFASFLFICHKKQLKKPPKPRFLIRSLSLTPEMDATVQQLAQEASDQLGWMMAARQLSGHWCGMPPSKTRPGRVRRSSL